MILLDNFAGTFPQWISAAIALATFIVAIISKFTIKKIKELTDITIALKAQTEELASQTLQLARQTEINKNRFDLEYENSFFASSPNFKPVT